MSSIILPLSWIITVPCGGFLGYINGSRIGAALNAKRLAKLRDIVQTKAAMHKGPAYQIVASNGDVYISVPGSERGVASSATIPFVSLNLPAKFVSEFSNSPEGRAFVQQTYGLKLDPSLPTTFGAFTLQSYDGAFCSIKGEGGLSALAARTTDEIAEAILAKEMDREKVGRYSGFVSGVMLGMGLPIPVILAVLTS